ncbi:MAG: M28 family peptidase [Bacteroidetes bacterium]|nr:M28 family peptidase [Bacteroidota bacterium]
MNIEKTLKFIQLEFEKIGLTCSTQTFIVDGNEYKNIYAVIPGQVEETFVVGAHYDTCDKLPGADDNASGVAGVIEAARLVKDHGNPYFTLIFSFFSLEEPPFFGTKNMGSYRFAELLNQQNRKIRGMVSVEMIGFFTDDKIQQYPPGIFEWLYPKEANFIASVSNINSSNLADEYQDKIDNLNEIHCVQFSGPSSVPGIDLSDHSAFWHFGYEAFMITDTSFLRNRNYHTQYDLSSTLDYKRMSFVVNGLVLMVTNKF